MEIIDAADHEWIDCEGHYSCKYCVRCGVAISDYRRTIDEAIEQHRVDVEEFPHIYEKFGQHGGLSRGGRWTSYPSVSTRFLLRHNLADVHRVRSEQHADEPPF